MSDSKFQISLRENGEHSLKKSLESYSEYDKTKDQMLLKDTILFLHNGIELLMKEMLVRNGIDIFLLTSPSKSITYGQAYKHVHASINPPELDETLLLQLDKLNRLRNPLEHYAIDADKEEVVQILEAIHQPILNLFEKHLGTLNQLRTPKIQEAWKSITRTNEMFKQKNHEIAELMGKFNGQRVFGSLFGVEGEVALPKFDSISEKENIPIDLPPPYATFSHKIDILAKSAGSSNEENVTEWAVITRLSTPSKVSVGLAIASAQLSVGLAIANAQLANSVLWLVVFAKVSPSIRSEAKKNKVMITGLNELEKLKRFVKSNN